MRLFHTVFVLTLIALVCGCSDDDKHSVDVKNAVVKAIESGNPKDCQTVLADFERENPGSINDCLKTVATKTNTTDACKLIDKKDKIADCTTDVALKTRDPLTCNEIEDATDKGNCASKVLLVLMNDAEEFASEKVNSAYDRLYGEGAHCNKLEEDYELAECHYKAAIKYNSVDLCKKLGNREGGVDNCLLTIAIRTSNRNICKEIQYHLKDTCENRILVELVKKSQDISVCEKASSEVEKNRCYKESGIVLGYASACRELPTEKEKTDCIHELNKRHSI